MRVSELNHRRGDLVGRGGKGIRREDGGGIGGLTGTLKVSNNNQHGEGVSGQSGGWKEWGEHQRVKAGGDASIKGVGVRAY